MTKKYLVDTHCFLWHFAQPERLENEARVILNDAASELWLSVASVWEIVIKNAVGKLALPEPAYEFAEFRIAAMRCSVLPIELRHFRKLAELPHYHRDPFDRILVAQALTDGFTLITADDAIMRYDVPSVGSAKR